MISQQNEVQYKIFNEKKARLLKFIYESENIYNSLGMQSRAETSEKLIKKIKEDGFKAIVIGEFKRGKSTFINALLGDEILPAFATPCTAVINEVKYGEQKKAVLHFKNPLPENANYSYKPEIEVHIKKYADQKIPPITIRVEELEDYVVIPDPAKDQNNSVAESPYSKVELFYPLDLCKNGVEIIDSPGLNEHGTRTKVTTDYLSEVDAILFAMSCQALASASEMEFIENKIRFFGHEEIFFICNRFDEVREKEKERVVSYAKSKLGPQTKFGESGVFFISAAEALDGKIDKNSELVEKSRLPLFEKRLTDFFTNERGKVKLNQPLKELLAGHKEIVKEEIPRQLKMLEISTEEIERKYEAALPRLKEAEHKRDQIMKKIASGRMRLKTDVRTQTSIEMRDLADKVNEWVVSYEPENKFKFIGGEGTKKQIENLSTEIISYLSKRFEKEQDEWAKNKLTPLVVQHFEEIKENIDDSIELFLKDIENIKADVSGFKFENKENGDVSGLEKVLSAAGGFIIGGAGSAFVGATMGSKEMLKSLVPNIALALGAILIGITNPFILIPMLLGAGFVQGLLKASSVTDNTKIKVAEEYSRKIKEKVFEISEEISEKVFQQTDTFEKSVDFGLNKEINSIKQTVDTILKEKRKGEEQVAERKKDIQNIALRISVMDTEIVEMIAEVNT
ncbi:MAG TPA: dynamin family protein [bacterium]|nr:dynamin family protein [bacterium]